VKEIAISKGGRVFVDDDDVERLSAINWLLTTPDGHPYAVGWDKISKRHIYMHRFILGAKRGEFVDHKNGNGLDNRKENLRICTQSQNNGNSRQRVGASGFRGVHKHVNGLYYARLTIDGKSKSLGCARQASEAARMYDAAARGYFGEFASLNFPLCPAAAVSPVGASLNASGPVLNYGFRPKRRQSFETAVAAAAMYLRGSSGTEISKVLGCSKNYAVAIVNGRCRPDALAEAKKVVALQPA